MVGTGTSPSHDLLRRFAPIVCGWVVVIAGLAIWLGSSPDYELRDQLRRWQFWFLEAQFALLIGLTAANLGSYIRSLRLSRQDYLTVAAAGGLALLLAGTVAPRTNRIYYDEQIYQGIAQNLSDLRLAQMCNDGTVEYGQLQCWRGEYNKQPYGYPYLLSVVYRIFGVSYWTAARFNVLCAALLVGTVFFIASGLFEDRWAARAAALITALIPEQLLWSHTAAAEPSSAMAGAFAILAGVHFVRERTTLALVWVVAATSFAVQFRVESLLILVVVGVAVVLWAPAEFGRCRLWAWSLVGLILSAALVAHLVAVRQEQWGTPGDRMSLAFAARNLATNARFYLADPRFPALYTVLALCALAGFRHGRSLVLSVTYFFLFWGIYLLFYAGSYNYGADVRYSIMTYPPLALIAGAGAAEVMRALQRFGLAAGRAAALLVAVLGLQFLWYMPLVRAVGEEAWAARADIAFAQRVAGTLPKNSITLTHNPSVFQVMGINAAQLSLVTNEPGYVKGVLLPRYAGGVFLHWNFWCNVTDPVQQEFCKTALLRFPNTLVREDRERDYRYAFYKLDVLPAAGP
jgi:Dolichyl-phosphate-mannose-protein mannosyltransferase